MPTEWLCKGCRSFTGSDPCDKCGNTQAGIESAKAEAATREAEQRKQTVEEQLAAQMKDQERNQQRQEEFLAAVETGDVEAVKVLVASAGEDAVELVTHRDFMNFNALTLAIVRQDLKMASVLLGVTSQHPEKQIFPVKPEYGVSWASALHKAVEYTHVASDGAILTRGTMGSATLLDPSIDIVRMLLEAVGERAEELRTLRNADLGKSGETAFESYIRGGAHNPDLAHLLAAFRPYVQPKWFPAEQIAVQDDPDHLEFGVTAQTAEEILKALEFDSYKRDEQKLDWVTENYGPDPVGYDVCAAVKIQFKARSYNKISCVEWLLHQSYPGAGRATAFLSHAQKETLALTLGALKRFEIRMGAPVIFFVDYFTLRQCINDFNLDKVKECIKAIGRTVMLAEPWDAPFTLTRTFCAFEVYATLDEHIAFEVVFPPEQERKMMEDIHAEGRGNVPSTPKLLSVAENLDVRNAEARNPEHKQMIDEFIENGPGFEQTNSIVGTAMQCALLLFLHRSNDNRHSLLRNGVARKILTKVEPKITKAILEDRAAFNQQLLHCWVGEFDTHLEDMRAIFEHVGNPQDLLMSSDQWGKTPLHIAASRGHRPTICWLLSSAEDPEAMLRATDMHPSSKTPLDVIDDMLRLLQESGDVGQVGHFAKLGVLLRRAASRGPTALRNLQQEEEIREAFAAWDTDDSGVISREELKDVMMKLESSMSESDIDKLMAVADTNQNGTIEIDEFIDWVLRDGEWD